MMFVSLKLMPKFWTTALLLSGLVIIKVQVHAQEKATPASQHLLMDFGWRFAYGHPSDPQKDYNHATGYFSYLAKTGYGDGAAAPNFDDRSWRKLNLPHDWAVEQPFSSKASFSHGFKTVGPKFSENSIGWYRKSFTIPSTDLGRRIHIAFDGVFRNSVVWVNGHYLGTEPSGYLGFEYDITDYLNYGGNNVIAVRADATMEEGWFYEGAGIYRHVWLNKFNEVHIQPNGVFVSTAKVDNANALISVKSNIANEGKITKKFSVVHEIMDAAGRKVASVQSYEIELKAYESKDVNTQLSVANAVLWSLETPYLYKLVTTVKQANNTIDQQQTNFGIRTIYFDADKGFFLNGKSVKIKGTNNHQDHAGLGVALPDGLQDFRIKTLKQMGSNAYRCSHNPPTPELLDACDRLGMLVIDENRLMGTASTELNDLKRLILRDRNHPSIVSWSVGNEEWGIEGNITGARIAATMQAFAKSIDTTRYITAAISGGVGNGISTVIDVMGYNYIATKNTDEQHQKFPKQKSWGTEEGSTVTSRGIYVDDRKNNQLAAYDIKQNDSFYSLENGWKHYAQRPYLAGMFIWTGFDYRGEPTPFGWPSTGSYFGMVDQCGFAKDDVYYLRSWWSNQPTIHILPHWNWSGKEGQAIDVWVYSNADEVELFLNNRSQGKKAMEKNGHLEWKVNYISGTLRAVGYKNGKLVMKDAVATTAAGVAINLAPNVAAIKADKEDVVLITVDVKDKNGLHVPTSNNDITFSIAGPGAIIGIGNGDPTSLEPDKYLESIRTISINNIKEKTVENMENRPETAAVFDDSNWATAFSNDRTQGFAQLNKFIVYRAAFNINAQDLKGKLTFFYNSIGQQQSIYINGKQIANSLPQNSKGDAFIIDAAQLKEGANSLVIVATPLFKKQSWETVNTNPGVIQVLQPPAPWKRKLFSGLAQVVIQSTGGTGNIILKATSQGVKQASVTINAQPTKPRPAIEE